MIKVQDFVRTLGLTVIVSGDRDEMDIRTTDLIRPGLHLTGFWDYFAFERVQVMGKAEIAYLELLGMVRRREVLCELFSYDVPCVVVCRGLNVTSEMIECATEHRVPIFSSPMVTTRFVLNTINFLNDRLAPKTTQHGGLVDVYGVGMLITGESGVGKSETALELVKRGHRLVADDVVEIKRVSDNRVIGESPEMVRHYMEIRGIGIIDVSALYGVGAVLKSKSIDLVIHMEMWKQNGDYDRLGLTEQYTSILNVNVPKILLPIHPGRNLAIVLEVAARNFRMKQNGYNAAQMLDAKLNAQLKTPETQSYAEYI